MKRIFLIIFLYFITLGNALAVNLIDALKQALENNTELNAERENIKISRDDLKISKSNYLPTATISGSKSKENTNKLTNQSGGDASINDVDPLTTSLKIEQTLIDFSRNAELKKKKLV